MSFTTRFTRVAGFRAVVGVCRIYTGSARGTAQRRTMHLMYYDGADGKRVYSLKVRAQRASVGGRHAPCVHATDGGGQRVPRGAFWHA